MIQENFLPVRVHVRDQAEEFRRLSARYGAHWTPAVLILDAQGQERHRIEGFLPVDEFLPQLALGLGRAAFARSDYAEAEQRFRGVLERHPDSDAAPAALYWSGVSRYKASGDATALAETARELGERYPESTWAKKGSIWGGNGDR